MGTHFCVMYLHVFGIVIVSALIFEDAEMCHSDISRRDSPMESGQYGLKNACQRCSDEVFQ